MQYNDIHKKLFRKRNEALIRVAIAKFYRETTELAFYCECTDIRCREVIKMTAGSFIAIHKNRRRFIMKYGHNVAKFEKIIDSTNGYCVVQSIEPTNHSEDKLL